MSIRHQLIIAWTAMGLDRKEIALLLKRSLKCVEWHLAKIKLILGYNDPARLTHFAIQNRLVKLNQTA